jgi:hypothetical protein
MIGLEDPDLHRNRIEHVDRDMFSGLFKLKYIDLRLKKLQYLRPDTFLRNKITFAHIFKRFLFLFLLLQFVLYVWQLVSGLKGKKATALNETTIW